MNNRTQLYCVLSVLGSFVLPKLEHVFLKIIVIAILVVFGSYTYYKDVKNGVYESKNKFQVALPIILPIIIVLVFVVLNNF